MRYSKAIRIVLESTPPLHRKAWNNAVGFAEDVLDDLDALPTQAPFYDWSARGWA
jgi:hypothetical protein